MILMSETSWNYCHLFCLAGLMHVHNKLVDPVLSMKMQWKQRTSGKGTDVGEPHCYETIEYVEPVICHTSVFIMSWLIHLTVISCFQCNLFPIFSWFYLKVSWWGCYYEFTCSYAHFDLSKRFNILCVCLYIHTGNQNSWTIYKQLNNSEIISSLFSSWRILCLNHVTSMWLTFSQNN